jgi:hypothetical protein
MSAKSTVGCGILIRDFASDLRRDVAKLHLFAVPEELLVDMFEIARDLETLANDLLEEEEHGGGDR